MPITRPHELSVVQIHTSAMGSQVILGGLEDLSVPANTDVRGGATSGTLYSEHESIAAQRPEIAFTSVASIATALNTVGLLGRDLTAGVNTGLAAYLVKRQKGGSYASGAAHRRYRMASGIIVPTSLRASFQEDARLSYRAVAIYDGVNAPLAEQDSQSIPSGAVRNERFSLYSVSIGGTTFDAATSVEVDFGVGVILSEGATGNLSELVWPTHVAINSVQPVITIGGIDPEWVSGLNVPLLGRQASHASSVIRLARRKHGSTFYATNEAQHIRLTYAGLSYVDQVVTASDKANGTVSLMIRTIHDGVNVPLVITTGSTL